MEQEKVQRPLQRHPAFYADLQIELEAMRKSGWAEDEKHGWFEGEKMGRREGIHSFAKLSKILLQQNRQKELLRALEDEQYLEQLFQEHHI